MKENIEKLWELINTSNKILLINHIRMDMDAFGSLSWVYDILKQLWKDVKAINDENPPENYNITWYNHIIEVNLDIKAFNPDLIISFDAASEAQLWEIYKNNIEIFKNTPFVVIDHHKTNPGFWSINIINSDYSSTCELTYDVLKQLNLTKYITSKIATSILSWIYTDTNIYYNSNTSSNTLRISAELIDFWANFRKPYFEFYKKKTFSKSKLWWKVLSEKLNLSDNWKIAWAKVPKYFFEETNSNERELTGLISEFFINIPWVEISFISYELDNWNIKTSFRSSENYDVSDIAASLGWWWHKQAAWLTLEKNLEEVEKMILEKIKEVI